VVQADELVAITRHSENDTPLAQPELADGKILRVRSVPTEAGNDATELVERQAVKVDTGWVEFPEVFGTGSQRAIDHGTMEDVAAVVADMSEGANNGIRVIPEPFPGCYTIRASRGAGVNLTTYFGELGTNEMNVKDRERRQDTADEGGYKWREINIYIREYIGTVARGGSALMGALYNINEVRAGLAADSDSILPQVIGRTGGHAVYRSVRIERTFSATWQPSSSDSR
jgi:hypothetical protein